MVAAAAEAAVWLVTTMDWPKAGRFCVVMALG
jgi:hypothetical protein